jgi:hypothetical protein
MVAHAFIEPDRFWLIHASLQTNYLEAAPRRDLFERRQRRPAEAFPSLVSPYKHALQFGGVVAQRPECAACYTNSIELSNQKYSTASAKFDRFYSVDWRTWIPLA